MVELVLAVIGGICVIVFLAWLGFSIDGAVAYMRGVK